jgi:hypothetical protein
MDISDKAAVKLLKRIADKAIEPLADGPADKTVGEWRQELAVLHTEAISYFAARHAALGTEPDLS